MGKRIHLLNENFLDEWTSRMAYVLGFWFADGYMRHEKSYRIAFSSSDYDLIIAIREAIGSDHPIRTTRGKKSKKDEYSFVIFSKKMYSALLGLGGERRKSKSMVFPKVPDKFLADFIRGYFDGDGSVFYTTYFHSKIHRMRTELRSNFTSGSPEFLEKVKNILMDKLNFTDKKVCPFNDGGSWKFGYGTKETKELLKFMYYPEYPIGLKRKAVFLEKASVS